MRKKTISEFEVRVSSNGSDFKNNFFMSITNSNNTYHLAIFDISLDEFIDILDSCLSGNHTVPFVSKLTPEVSQALKNNSIKIENCCFCNTDKELYQIASNHNYNSSSNTLYLCKTHLKKFNEYLKDLSVSGHVSLTGNKLKIESYKETD